MHLFKKSQSNNDIILKKIKKVLVKYFSSKYVSANEEFNVVASPVGKFIKIKNKWFFSFDFSNIYELECEENIIDNQMLILSIIRDISQFIPDLKFTLGFHSIYDNDGYYSDLIFNDDILDYMYENGTNFSASKTILANEIINKNKEN
jgi:hypothetical protein